MPDRGEIVTVKKYPIPVPTDASGIVEVTMPEGAHIMTVQLLDGKPWIWVQTRQDAIRERRKILVIPTEISVEVESGRYIGTVVNEEARLVFHFYEIADD